MKTQREFPVLIIDGELQVDNAGGRAIRAIRDNLREDGLSVLEATTAEDGESMIVSDPSLGCVLVGWHFGPHAERDPHTAAGLVERVRAHNSALPIFILTDRTQLQAIPLDVIRVVTGYIWKLEDTANFIAGRVANAVNHYLRFIMPPFFGELVRFAEDYEYSWHTPGHSGGTAFLKSPTGMAFHEFYGETMLRSDLSVSVPQLGSLMEHSGVVGEAERAAAKVFGADETYFVTNGTSSANKMVLHGCVTPGDVVLVDRNCHKSLQHALTMTGAIPVYLIPSRNHYGIIGPIHHSELQPETIQAKLADNPLVESNGDLGAALAVVTNSTYDGLCYDVDRVMELLGQSVDRVHFDEAWFGYAAFGPIYEGRYGMGSVSGRDDAPTVFATQSTHKLLAALSQGSMIHVKQGRAPVEHDRFNEAYMMHTSTSPQYSIIASLDVAARMMAGEGGRALTTEPIREAVAFRKKMLQITDELSGDGTGEAPWWFSVWQPDEVPAPDGRGKTAFADTPDPTLVGSPESWVLGPDDGWHGFTDLDTGWCLLDPIKVTIATPGVEPDGRISDWGIPAAIVARYLDTRGIVVEKTGFYSFLVLFSMGITQGKWGGLITELFAFKRLYDEDSSLEDVFPDLVGDHPARYASMTLRELGSEMHTFLRDVEIGELAEGVFSRLPEPEMTPTDAYVRLVRGQVEQVAVADMQGRTAAVMVVPYPPGIPILMPGERAAGEGGILDFLGRLQDFDARFPGFEHEVHGVELGQAASGDPQYRVYCLTDE